MDPIQPIGPRIQNIPSVERVGHRIDPEQQKREQQKREEKRKREQPQQDPEEPQDDDGLPHIDVCA
jgi:hypothetical protein